MVYMTDKSHITGRGEQELIQSQIDAERADVYRRRNGARCTRKC
jgi:hypothetical protein